jgi:hypothetical protein
MRRNVNDVKDAKGDIASNSAARETNEPPRLNLAELTMAKRSTETTTPPSTTGDDSEIKVPSLAEMTMLK